MVLAVSGWTTLEATRLENDPEEQQGYKLAADRKVVKWVNQDGSPANRGMRAAGDPFPLHATFFSEEDAKAYLDLRARVKRYYDACVATEDEIQQILGKALGYPRYCDDQKVFPGTKEEDGVCVFDNTAASLAMEAAEKLKKAEDETKRLKEWLNRIGFISPEQT